jgi:hypothetical protein
MCTTGKPSASPEEASATGRPASDRCLHNAKMEDVASVAHAAIVKRDWGALQPLLHPYLHWVQADGQVVRGRTKVIGMLQAIGISGPPASVELRDGQVYRWYV